MIKLPENLKEYNLSNEEYMALSKEERIFLLDKLGTNDWLCFSEAHPNTPKPKLPCVINGAIIGE